MFAGSQTPKPDDPECRHVVGFGYNKSTKKFGLFVAFDIDYHGKSINDLRNDTSVISMYPIIRNEIFNCHLIPISYLPNNKPIPTCVNDYQTLIPNLSTNWAIKTPFHNVRELQNKKSYVWSHLCKILNSENMDKSSQIIVLQIKAAVCVCYSVLIVKIVKIVKIILIHLYLFLLSIGCRCYRSGMVGYSNKTTF